MSPLRTVAVLVVFLGLAALEVFNGFSRVSSLREARHRELVEQIERGHAILSRRLAAQLEDGRRRAAFLARLPRRDVSPDALGAELEAFVATFDDIAGVALLDDAGAPLAAREARADGTFDTAGDALLADLPRPPRAGILADTLDPREPLRAPAPRVLAAAPHAGTADARPGAPAWVLLELSPRPFLEALSAFHPLDPTAALLVAGDVGVDDATPSGGLRLVDEVLATPPLWLVTTVPAEAFESAMAPLRREYAWILVPMVGVTLALALIGAVVLRLSQRSFRLRETEHYLRWIRRVTDRYRALMEGAADMILIVEPGSGRLREANAAARAALGLADAGAPTPGGETAPPRGPLAEHFARDDRPRLTEALRRAGDAPGRPVALHGLRVEPVDGPPLAVDGHFASVDLGDERVVEVSLRDVTHQRAIERQLHTAERLGSLGMLTAGVAHEINNPLEGIGNYLGLLEREDLGDDVRRRYLDRVRSGFGRIRDIVQDLLSFARPSVDTGHADLAAVVEAALGMAAYSETFTDVTVERRGLDAPLEAVGDAGRLEQVVLNLLLNAARAVQGRGAIRIEGRRDEDGHVELAVSDDGPGIPDEHLDKLFDPFFSGHGGTGLGLSVSFGIVSAHGGRLTATNREGGGACFTLRLPAPPPTTSPSPPESRP